MNEKSHLQIRAERAAEQFADKARKPLVVEFAGVPKAGKTTTLDPVEDQIAENILSCPKEAVTELFGDKNFIGGSQAAELARRFNENSESDFRPRHEVEEDKSRIQALPVVIVRNKSGGVLRLCRREKKHDNPLHNKIVIWAGGHVHCEDAVNGDPLIHCAIRELAEELRLQIEAPSLRLIGAVYFDNGGKTSRHVGIAYEWRAPTDDVSIVLSRSEFFERRGTSLKGSFSSVDDLIKEIESKTLKEPWSVELVRESLAEDAFSSNPRLL